MKIYNDKNLEEWSRVLIAKHGANFRLYSNEQETMERWAYHLSSLYKIEPDIRKPIEETLKDWSKLIGG